MRTHSKKFSLGVVSLMLAAPAVADGLDARQSTDSARRPLYKNPNAPIEARIKDLLPRMSLEEKVSQLIQGDIGGWMNMSDPLDNTLTHNATGLANMMRTRAGSIWAGYSSTYEKFVYAVTVGQKYLMENTTLGIPALIQSEGLHGFTNNGTIWPSPIGLASSFNPDLVEAAAKTISNEAEVLGINHLFAPVLDLGRELRWGRVEEGFGEDPHLTAEMAYSFVKGIQSGQRRNVSSTATARMAATCKHFAAFGSPQGGLNLAQVSGGERELRSAYLRPFQKGCLEALSMMSTYSSYDGVPGVANYHLMTEILRNEWGYKYWVTTDAGAVDLLWRLHYTCDGRECAAKAVIENALSGEMGGGTYTFETLPAQVRAGKVRQSAIDKAVEYILRVKFSLGLFENPYPYPDYDKHLRTNETMTLLHQMEQEQIVLLDNKKGTLPLKKGISSVALIGPSAGQVMFGDYVFYNATLNGLSALDGFRRHLEGSGTAINYAEGCKHWSNDKSGFPEAVAAAEKSEAVVVVVGTWSRDQTLLWQGLNATTGEHVDVHDLGLVGAQLDLVKAVKATGKPTIVVFIAGKPVSEPWIARNADAVISQFYPGELGGLALAELIFGAYSPSGRLSLSWPEHVGTQHYYDYLKGSGGLDEPGTILDDGTIKFGHSYVTGNPDPLWGFGHGLSYSNFTYSALSFGSNQLRQGQDLQVKLKVKNNGPYRSKEVVQVYMTDKVSSVVTPNQFLAGFTKVDLAVGETKDVTVTVKFDDLGLWSSRNRWEVESGEFNVRIGTSTTTYLSGTVSVA